MKRIQTACAVLCTLATLVVADASTFAADNVNPPPASGETPERIDVEKLKKKYWAKGDEAALRVVQNRLYSKAGKFELGGFGGWVSNDPFLSINNLGGNFGYYFNEFFGVGLLYWKDFVSDSSALTQFQAQMHSTVDTNKPSSFLGGELKASLLYGKLSLLGQAIIYFDMHVDAGAGSTSTESGSYFTPFGGIGQDIYINRWLSLQLNYRLMFYSENVLEKVGPPATTVPIGGIATTRSNTTNVITVGFNILANPFTE